MPCRAQEASAPITYALSGTCGENAAGTMRCLPDSMGCLPKKTHAHPTKMGCHPAKMDCRPKKGDCHPAAMGCHPPAQAVTAAGSLSRANT